MKNELVKKSLIFGTIIILLIGASVLPVVNAKQIQNPLLKEKNEDGKLSNLTGLTGPFSIRFLLVKFNITFFGETWFYPFIIGGPMVPDCFWFWAWSNDSVISPVAVINISTFDNKPLCSITWDSSLVVRIGWIPECHYNLTHPEDNLPDPDGGYISGRAVLLRIKQK